MKPTNPFYKITAALLLFYYSSPIFAAGGLSKATDTANDVKTGIYAFVGASAGLYLLYVGILAKTEKKSWADFGWAVVHVALVGASISLATWAWSLFA